MYLMHFVFCETNDECLLAGQQGIKMNPPSDSDNYRIEGGFNLD